MAGHVLPEFVVVPFPASRRIALARQTADTLSVIDPKRAKTYWRKILARLRREMAASGLDPETIEHELRGFWCAVDDLLPDAATQSSWPGGSAA